MSENKPENEQLAKPTRELTEKERIRFEGFQKICAEKKAQGFVMKDKTYGVVYANVMAFVLFIPFVIIFALLFLALLPSDFLFTYNPIATWIILLVFIVSIFIHEGLHGLGWGLFAPNKFKSIEFGFIAKMLTPYCTCREPISRPAYLFGCLLPWFVLGIVPCVIAVCASNFYLLGFGLLGIMGAGGDMLITLGMLTSKLKSKDAIIIDHPTDVGFVIFDKD